MSARLVALVQVQGDGRGMTATATPPVDTPGNRAGGPVLGLAEAARVCGVSVATMRRKKAELVELGAVASADGWAIPVAVLVRLGLMDGVTPPGGGRATDVTPHAAPPSDTGGSAVEADLRRRLDEALRRAELAEALAAERAAALEVERMALRMLTGAVTPAASVDQGGQSGRRSWWRRR